MILRSRLFHDDLYKMDILGLRCEIKDIGRVVRRCRILPGVKKTIIEHFEQMDPKGSQARCVGVNSNAVGRVEYVVIWLRPQAPTSTVAHEAFHATYLILKGAGCTLADASEEAYAYHLAWVIRELNNLW